MRMYKHPRVLKKRECVFPFATRLNWEYSMTIDLVLYVPSKMAMLVDFVRIETKVFVRMISFSLILIYLYKDLRRE